MIAINKTRIILYALCMGILIGITIFSQPPSTPTGQAIANCYIDNDECICGLNKCRCGNQTVPISYCTQSIDDEFN